MNSFVAVAFFATLAVAANAGLIGAPVAYSPVAYAAAPVLRTGPIIHGAPIVRAGPVAYAAHPTIVGGPAYSYGSVPVAYAAPGVVSTRTIHGFNGPAPVIVG